MKRSLLPLLVCPHCHKNLLCRTALTDHGEIVEGEFLCSGCGQKYPITRGVPRFVSQKLSAQQQATANAFGYEWTHYSQLTEADRHEFLGWIAPLIPNDFEGQTVLDAGCGKGRHIYLAADFGARTVIGVDLSDAVEAAYQNTLHLPNVHVVQADVAHLPFVSPFDLVYSIGVLHHLPAPSAGFRAVASQVRSGGRISAWVYGKEGNRWLEVFVDPVRKYITARLPKRITSALAYLPALLLYAALKTLYKPARGRPGWQRLLPYSAYLCAIADYTFAENFWNVFDQLIAPTSFYIARGDFNEWFRSINAQNIFIEQHNGNSWRGTAVLP